MKILIKIILTGQVPFSDIPKYLSSADYCLLPAYKNRTMENIVPIKLYEYLVAGKPVISTRLKGILKEFGENDGVLYIDESTEVFKVENNTIVIKVKLLKKG